MLWDACRRGGMRHIHAQLGRHRADGGDARGRIRERQLAAAREPWSWSQRLHGSKEFYDIHPERLAERAASASFVACISDYARSQVMAFVPEKLWAKLVVVRCGVDLREFARRGPRRSQELRILTVGRLDPMKGTVLLIQALAQLGERGLRPALTVVGRGPSSEQGRRRWPVASASTIV